MYELGSVSVHAFEHDPEIVYHIDEFRNVSRDFYPFKYPSFEQVLGEDCDAIMLGIMRWTMSLPIARVILIQDLRAVDRHFSNSEHCGTPVILQSSVYTSYYPAFAALKRINFIVA